MFFNVHSYRLKITIYKQKFQFKITASIPQNSPNQFSSLHITILLASGEFIDQSLWNSGQFGYSFCYFFMQSEQCLLCIRKFNYMDFMNSNQGIQDFTFYKLKQFIMPCLSRRYKRSKDKYKQPLPPNQYGSQVRSGDKSQPSSCFPAKRTTQYGGVQERYATGQYRPGVVVPTSGIKIQKRSSSSSSSKQKKRGGIFGRKKSRSSSSSSSKNKDKKGGIFGFGKKSSSSKDKDKKHDKRSSSSSSKGKKNKISSGVVVGGVPVVVSQEKRSRSSSSEKDSSQKKKSFFGTIKEKLTGSKIKQPENNQAEQIVAATYANISGTNYSGPNHFQTNHTHNDYIHEQFSNQQQANFRVKGISLQGINLK